MRVAAGGVKDHAASPAFEQSAEDRLTVSSAAASARHKFGAGSSHQSLMFASYDPGVGFRILIGGTGRIVEVHAPTTLGAPCPPFLRRQFGDSLTMNGSEEKWEAFNIDCRPETETADIFVVVFNPKPDAGQSAPNKSSPAIVTIENTAGNLVTLEVKEPESAMLGISAEDYSKQACVIVRQMLEQA